MGAKGEGGRPKPTAERGEGSSLLRPSTGALGVGLGASGPRGLGALG
jgi:hypothetical protein